MHIPRKLKFAFHTIIQFGGVVLLGWYFGKLINVLITIPLFFIFRRRYDKTYHARCVNECTIQTLIMFVIILKLNVDIGLSILLTVMITYLNTEILYHIQEYIDLKAIAKKINEKKTKTLRQRILAVVPNDEDKIEKLCKGFGLINLSETIYLYLNNTIEEVAAILEIDSATVNRRVKRFLKTVEA